MTDDTQLAAIYGCQFLADIIRGQFNERLLSGIQRLPEVHDGWKQAYQQNQEAAKWDHHRTLALDILPYAGLFDSQLDISELPSLNNDLRPDHYSNLLLLAASDSHAKPAAIAALHRTCLPFTQALRHHPFYGPVGKLLLSLVQTWEFNTDTAMSDKHSSTSLSLRDIAQELSRPDHIGFWIGPSRIHRWSQYVEVPTVFGSRLQMLEGLLNHAADYEKFEALLTIIEDDIESESSIIKQTPPTIMTGAWQQILADAHDWIRQLSSNLKRYEQSV